MNWLKKKSISLKLVRRKDGTENAVGVQKNVKTFRKSGELVFKSNLKKDNAWLLKANKRK